MPRLSKKTISIVFTFDLAARAFTGPASPETNHSVGWRFVDGSYWKHKSRCLSQYSLRNWDRNQTFQPNSEAQWDVVLIAHLAVRGLTIQNQFLHVK